MTDNYEFSGFGVDNDNESRQNENNETSFIDFCEKNNKKKLKVKKLIKKASKPFKKKIKKQGKKIRRLNTGVKSEIKNLSDRITSVETDVRKIHKTSYKDLLYRLAEADNSTVRQQLLSEILSVEDRQ